MRRQWIVPIWRVVVASVVLAVLSRKVSAQLFENLEAFGERLDAGDPLVRSPREGPKGIASGDLDGDGAPDLALSNLDGTVTVYLNRGDGRFGAPLHLQTGAQTLRGIVIADLTGDGRPDILAAAPFDRKLFLRFDEKGALERPAPDRRRPAGDGQRRKIHRHNEPRAPDCGTPRIQLTVLS